MAVGGRAMVVAARRVAVAVATGAEGVSVAEGVAVSEGVGVTLGRGVKVGRGVRVTVAVGFPRAIRVPASQDNKASATSATPKRKTT